MAIGNPLADFQFDGSVEKMLALKNAERRLKLGNNFSRRDVTNFFAARLSAMARSDFDVKEDHAEKGLSRK